MSKIQIISDKNKKSLKIKSQLSKKIKSILFKKDNLAIVIGGDGFMLQTLKKNKDSKKQFYGINSGSYGFLMNKFSSKKIVKNLHKANIISISPLEMTVKNNKNQIRKHLAANRYPILGDKKYAGDKNELSLKQPRQMLHAYKLIFNHPYTNEKINVKANLPNDFKRCLNQLKLI